MPALARQASMWSTKAMNDLLLHLELADSAHGPVFDRFFEGYEQAFTLPDETEDRDGFADCLGLNHGKEHERLAGQYGAFRELCVVATDRRSGEMIGGANFIALAPASQIAPLTANLNYLYICPSARGRGALRTFLRSLSELIGSMFDADTRQGVAIFIEQNDPFRMTREAYERDSAHSGMDQFTRLKIWARLGALVVDFPYVQPPLSRDQKADETLVYSVLGLSGPVLAPDVLRHHLAAFFAISVLKGRDCDGVPQVGAQLAALDSMAANGEQIRLLDPRAFLGGLGDPDALLQDINRPQDLRSALAASMTS